MTDNEVAQDEDPSQRGLSNLVWAWLSVAFISGSFVAATVVAEALFSALTAGTAEERPIVPIIVTAIVATLIFLIPCVAAIVFARRAMRGSATHTGDKRGLWPLLVSAALIAWWVLTNSLGFILG